MRPALLEHGASPFSEGARQLLAGWADRRLDLSDEWSSSPEAAEAILDYYFPDGRHRADGAVALMRLQLVAELEVGTRLRAAQQREDEQVLEFKRYARGAGRNR